MRRGIGRTAAAVVLAAMLFHDTPPASSKPMSGDLIPAYQELERLLKKVVCGADLDESEVETIVRHLRGSPTPLFWLAAYITGEAKDESGKLLNVLRKHLPESGRMNPGHAFASMAILKRENRGKPRSEQIEALRALEDHDNHYLRIAVAKQMMRVDLNRATDTLKRMNNNRASILLHSESDRLLRTIKGEPNPRNPWIGGEQYAMVVMTTEPSALPGYCKTEGDAGTRGGEGSSVK